MSMGGHLSQRLRHPVAPIGQETGSQAVLQSCLVRCHVLQGQSGFLHMHTHVSVCVCVCVCV